jgi:argininosuccinate lyase
VISDDEAGALSEGLWAIKRELDQGKFQFDDSLEDIHMHIEARLLQTIGKVAQKLHTGRSRNDQVALDVRMFLREALGSIIQGLGDLRRVLTRLAEQHIDVVMPGYTHLQRAQPVLLAHHWMAYYEMFTRDADRFADCLKRTNVMPLGAAALAGTTYPIDRHHTAQLLNFPHIAANSIDAVSDRDFILEFLSAASICMVHFSRMSEELVLWSSSEFGFIELADAFATGSSIMPQKKNPDIPELIRGKTGRVFGDLIAMLTLMKSLPLAYNRDMQEDKPPLFDAVDTLQSCLDITLKMLPTISDQERGDAPGGIDRVSQCHRHGRLPCRPGGGFPQRPCNRGTSGRFRTGAGQGAARADTQGTAGFFEGDSERHLRSPDPRANDLAPTVGRRDVQRQCAGRD